MAIITDESGAIWLKCNNTSQIQHNPSHLSNWPALWQSGHNFLITTFDPSYLKILWSYWKMRDARQQLSSLHLNILTHLCFCTQDMIYFSFFFWQKENINSIASSDWKPGWVYVCLKFIVLLRLNRGAKFIWLERWEVCQGFILPQISVHRKSEW